MAIARPQNAPQGEVRAHLATFPPRAGILRRAVDAILPQVDRLFIVLNGYDAVPEDFAANPKITAVIPDRDVRDAGKFWFAPACDDIVLLIDDDIPYPADYVSRSMAEAGAIGWDGNVFGYMSNRWHPSPLTGGAWVFNPPRKSLDRPGRVHLLGTGTVIARGDLIPPLAAMEPGHGHCDVMFSDWVLSRGHSLWVLPRPERWLTQQLPEDLRASSLFVSAHPFMPPLVSERLARLARRTLPSDQNPLSALTSRAAPVAAAEE